MNTTVKLAAALGAVALSAGVAHAAAIQPSTGNGNLMFFLTDPSKGITYTDVLTQDVNTYFSKASATTPAPTAGVVNTVNGDANFSINLATDANLQTFLAATGADALNWGIIAGAYTNSGAQNRPIGAARYVFTNSLPAALTVVPEASVTTGMVAINNDVTSLNAILGANSSTAGTTTATSGIFGTAQSTDPGLTFYGSGLAQLGFTPGTSTSLYGISGNGAAAGAGYAYNLGTIAFSANDVLTFTGNAGSPVPLPAAAWLLASGLLGLAGVSRRRGEKLA
jgi:hypothetical protein